MSKFIVIELDENLSESEQAQRIHETADMVYDGHTEHDYNPVFNIVNTSNHLELDDLTTVVSNLQGSPVSRPIGD